MLSCDAPSGRDGFKLAPCFETLSWHSSLNRTSINETSIAHMTAQIDMDQFSSTGSTQQPALSILTTVPFRLQASETFYARINPCIKYTTDHFLHRRAVPAMGVKSWWQQSDGKWVQVQWWQGQYWMMEQGRWVIWQDARRQDERRPTIPSPLNLGPPGQPTGRPPQDPAQAPPAQAPPAPGPPAPGPSPKAAEAPPLPKGPVPKAKAPPPFRNAAKAAPPPPSTPQPANAIEPPGPPEQQHQQQQQPNPGPAAPGPVPVTPGPVPKAAPARDPIPGPHGKYYGASGARSGLRVATEKKWHRSHGNSREKRNFRRAIGGVQNFCGEVESWARRVERDYKTLNQWSQETVTAMIDLQQEVRAAGQRTDSLGHTMGKMRAEAGKVNDYLQWLVKQAGSVFKSPPQLPTTTTAIIITIIIITTTTVIIIVLFIFIFIWIFIFIFIKRIIIIIITIILLILIPTLILIQPHHHHHHHHHHHCEPNWVEHNDNFLNSHAKRLQWTNHHHHHHYTHHHTHHYDYHHHDDCHHPNHLL